MTRSTLFSHPLLLGFEHFERSLERIARASTEGYPPYNVEQQGEDRLSLTLAVAGFRDDELEVSVEENQLVIRGQQQDDSADRVFLHRGIASRQFLRRFVLADGLEVEAASLAHGLLKIALKRPPPQPRVRRVRIESGTARPRPDAASRVVEIGRKERGQS